MGKLSELWAQYKSLERDDSRRADIQKEINNVEQWMIDKGYKTTPLTQWYNGMKTSPNYPEGTGYIWYEDLNKIGEIK